MHVLFSHCLADFADSMCGNENFVFNVMRMDGNCLTDVFSQEQGSHCVSTTAATLLCCCVVLDALFI